MRWLGVMGCVSIDASGLQARARPPHGRCAYQSATPFDASNLIKAAEPLAPPSALVMLRLSSATALPVTLAHAYRLVAAPPPVRPTRMYPMEISAGIVTFHA